MKSLKSSKLRNLILLSSLILLITSCSKKENVGPNNTLTEDPIQTETISGIFPVEVYVPGIYITQSPDKVGFCEERRNNTCMIIRYNRSSNNTDICDVELPNANSFTNSIVKSAEVKTIEFEQTQLTKDELTNVFSKSNDGSYIIKGIASKNNQNYLFNLKLVF
jgi:hypothetical protein